MQVPISDRNKIQRLRSIQRLEGKADKNLLKTKNECESELKMRTLLGSTYYEKQYIVKKIDHRNIKAQTSTIDFCDKIEFLLKFGTFRTWTFLPVYEN